MIELQAGAAKAQLAPDLGGAIASLEVADKPILRPWSQNMEDGLFALASNILVPFSNRIDGGFTFEGNYHAMHPNTAHDPVAIHGDGFQKAWRVDQASSDHAVLHLAEGSFGPYQYQAQQTFNLTPNGLSVQLSMTNHAAISLPYGGGFHPWFPRDTHTRLTCSAPLYWPSDTNSLPLTSRPQPVPEDYNFGAGSALPERRLDNAFSSWDGRAVITQGPDAVSVSVTSSTLKTAIIYAPDPQSGFFCFEPVSHPINAHNWDGQPGLEILAPNATLTLDMQLSWDGIH